MASLRLLLQTAPLLTACFFAACSANETSDSGDQEDSDQGSGGNGSPGDDSSSGGGTNPGSGGDGNGTPGEAAFTCPGDFSGRTPTLAEKKPTSLAVAPKVDGENRFLEGPVWVEGTLYVSQLRDWGDPAPARILQLQETNLIEVAADARAGTNGLAVRADGRIVGASQRVHGLLVFNPSDWSASEQDLQVSYEGKGLNSPNDLTIHSNGSIYLTDPDWNCGSACPQKTPENANNRVYRISPTGTVLQAIDPDHSKPNGIALSPDETTLYVAGDDAGIKKYALAADGTIGAKSDFASISGVDGMTVDCAGNLYATEHTQSRVSIFAPDGSSLGTLSIPENVTNVAFGGAENRTLFITGKAELYSVELDIPGYPY